VSGPDFRVEGADELRVAQSSEELDTPEPVLPEETEAEPTDDGDGDHAPGDLKIPEGVGAFVGHPNGVRRTVGIAVARFNGEITQRLLQGALDTLVASGVERSKIDVLQVPGAFELPLGAMALAKTKRYACVIALGCVIRGETPHFDFISAEAASGVQLAALETGVPVALGVLMCDTREQAEERSGGDRGNKGADAAETALEMADVFARMRVANGTPAGQA
jgi:6,7-dimethyl-8-ribityllumazine synthase